MGLSGRRLSVEQIRIGTEAAKNPGPAVGHQLAVDVPLVHPERAEQPPVLIPGIPLDPHPTAALFGRGLLLNHWGCSSSGKMYQLQGESAWAAWYQENPAPPRTCGCEQPLACRALRRKFTMHFDKALLDIDYLVYSSDKTATQTIAHTLRMNDFLCTHCHTVKNETVNIARGTFGKYVELYHLHNARQLNVISVFREPIERHISSFFQRHGSDVLRLGLLQDVTDTLIHNSSTEALQKMFRNELDSGTLTGKEESIYELCSELNLKIGSLKYDTAKKYGTVETDHCTLHLLRFDALIQERRLQSLLSQITGKCIVQHDENVSDSKWYYDRLKEFTKSLTLPRRTIITCYKTRASLFDLFYPGEYDTLLSRALVKYG
jgi:hypothetical protein